MNDQVSLSDMLLARERRASIQHQLLEEFHAPLICLTLNIPGPVKILPLVPDAFDKGCQSILSELEKNGQQLLARRELLEFTGYEAFFCVQADPMLLKHQMSALEDGTSLGRIFDIDVLDSAGQKLSRSDIGVPARTCLLCSENAHVCSRSRAHSVPELVEKISEILSKELLP